MNNLIFRSAKTEDIPFLVKAIIEAEKSGTETLTYTSIFGLSEDETSMHLKSMLLEEVENCELSISSFIVAENSGILAGAVSGWIEGIDGMPSLMLKSNLLKYFLPSDCLLKARMINDIVSELNIEYVKNTLQIGACYVAPEFRGKGINGKLVNTITNKLGNQHKDVLESFVQIFISNTASIYSFEKIGYKKVLQKVSANAKITNFLPSNGKVLLQKSLI